MIVDVDFSGEQEKMLAYCHEVVNNNYRNFQFLPPQYRDNKELVLKTIEAHPTPMTRFLEYVSAGLCDDEDVVFKAISKCRSGDEFEFASSRLKDDKQFVVLCMQCLHDVSYEMFDFIKTISLRLRGDKDVMSAAVAVTASCLMLASKQLRDDEEIVTSAINAFGQAIAHASDRLKNSRDLALQAVSNTGFALAGVPSFQDDKEVVMTAVQNDYFAFVYASPRLQKDKDVILAAVKSDPVVLTHMPQDLRDDSDVMDILRGKCQ